MRLFTHKRIGRLTLEYGWFSGCDSCIRVAFMDKLLPSHGDKGWTQLFGVSILKAGLYLTIDNVG